MPLTTYTPGEVLTAASLNDNFTFAADSGAILQVVTGTTSTATSSSTTSYAATTLTATITPTLATSTILVLISHTSCEKDTTNSGNSINLKLQRDSVDISTIITQGFFTNSSLFQTGSISAIFLDSPASTSALVYRTVFANNVASAEVAVQKNSRPSTIVLVELAA